MRSICALILFSTLIDLTVTKRLMINAEAGSQNLFGPRVCEMEKIGNGTLTTEYPAVLKLNFDHNSKSLCTGTQIRPGIILMSAHCFCYKRGIQLTAINDNEISDYQVKFHPKFSCEKQTALKHECDPSMQFHDLALVQVPTKNLPKQTVTIAQLPPKNILVDIVGFGFDQFFDPSGEELEENVIKSGLGMKRTSQNIIHSIGPESGIEIIGLAKKDSSKLGELGAALPGDSGGPMLSKDSQVIGVAACETGLGARSRSTYASTFEKSNFAFVTNTFK